MLEEALLEVEIAFEENPQDDELDRLLIRQANLLEEMERRGGWDYEYKIDTVLTKLGFSDAHRAASCRAAFRRMAQPRGAGEDSAASARRSADGRADELP